ncbi:hypothetical protein DDZ14_08000 [Maritimibacter sp. 55A14]|nr:hypothetical protein DDZ14_08000 [Maritimibacter sp. 55A14]
MSVHRVGLTELGGWVVSGTLAPRGICPDCGLHSRRRHGWRRRRFQDFPAHGEAVWVELRVWRWRCSSSGCRRGTFSDQDPTIAPPFTRAFREWHRLPVIWGMRLASDPPNVSCTDWALGYPLTNSPRSSGLASLSGTSRKSCLARHAAPPAPCGVRQTRHR